MAKVHSQWLVKVGHAVAHKHWIPPQKVWLLDGCVWVCLKKGDIIIICGPPNGNIKRETWLSIEQSAGTERITVVSGQLEVSGHRASQSLGFFVPNPPSGCPKNSQEIHHVVLALAGSNFCKHSSMAMMNMAALLMELPSFWIGNHRKV